MGKKRTQMHIGKVEFSQIEKTEQYVVKNENMQAHAIAESAFLSLYVRLGGNVIDGSITDAFLMHYDGKTEEDIEEYGNVLREGTWKNGKKYVRSVKSASMLRQQRTLFVEENLGKLMDEHICLGRVPEMTTLSKYEAAKGLALSSATQIMGIPRMVVVRDCEMEVSGTYQTVVRVEISDTGKEKIGEFNSATQRYAKLKKEVHEKIKLDKARKNMKETEKTMGSWERRNRRVLETEMMKPVSMLEYEGKKYPCYTEAQTEEFQFVEILPENIGYQLSEVKNGNVKMNVFDGQGFGSVEFFGKIKEEMELKYAPDAFQIRLPFLKGLVVQIDFHRYFQENGKDTVVDIFGDTHDVKNVDIILTESMMKAKHEKKEGKSGWLFNSMEDYYAQLAKYGWDSFGVANVAKNPEKISIYTPITYQILHALDMNLEKIRKIAKKSGNMYVNALSKDMAHTKAFLEMYEPEDEEYDEKISTAVQNAIDANSGMLHDPKVRNFLVKQVFQKMEEFMKGRIPVRGAYRYAVSDPIAMLEYLVGKEPSGFLSENQYFCAEKSEQGVERVLIRNPITSHREVVKGRFVKTENSYVSHLRSCVCINIHDFTAQKMGGMDFDGDIILSVADETILDSVMEGITILNENDKAVSNAVSYSSSDHIILFEKTQAKNANLTGVVTNIGTYFQNLAIEENGSVWNRDLEISVVKALQGIILDSAKTNLDVSNCIPVAMLEMAKMKPYFMAHVYGGKKTQYSWKVQTPFCQFVQNMENWMEKTFQKNKDGGFSVNVLEYVDTKNFLCDRTKYTESQLIALAKKLEPIYTSYHKEKQKVNREMQNFLTRKYDRDTALRKNIAEKYRKVFSETREKCLDICPNVSVLASVLVEMAYTKGTYSMPWDICPDGLIENLRNMQEEEKTDIIHVSELDRKEKEFHGNMRVSGGVARIDTAEFVSELEDGIYPVISICGIHYAEVKNNRKIVKKEESASIRELVKENSREKLENAQIRVLTFGEYDGAKAEELHGVIMKLEVVEENGVERFVLNDGEMSLTIAKESIVNVEKGYSLREYVGCEVIIRATEKRKERSFTAHVSVLS